MVSQLVLGKVKTVINT